MICFDIFVDALVTNQIVALGKSLNVAVHDHLIIGRDGFASFKGLQTDLIGRRPRRGLVLRQGTVG